jgi:hypothetical protein
VVGVGRMARGTVSPAGGEGGAESGAVRRAMRGAGRGGSATLDGGTETGSARLGRIAEERGRTVHVMWTPTLLS